MLIRRACSDDAAKACVVMRRSITELCGSDHRGDPEILDAWLANKTPAIFERWIADPGNVVLVAAEGDAVLAVVPSGSMARLRSTMCRRMHASGV